MPGAFLLALVTAAFTLYDAPMKKIYTVKATWDDEAKVWVAEGVNIRGLCTEAPTMEKLMKKLDVVVPELLKANGLLGDLKKVPFTVTSTVNAVAHLH